MLSTATRWPYQIALTWSVVFRGLLYAWRSCQVPRSDDSVLYTTYLYHRLHSAVRRQPNVPTHDMSNDSSEINLRLICLFLLQFPHKHQHYTIPVHKGGGGAAEPRASHSVQRAQYRRRWQLALHGQGTQHKALDKHCVYVQRRKKNLTGGSK